MTLSNPTLTLTFTTNDIQGASTQTITDAYIVNRSVSIKRQLLNGLKTASDTLSLKLTRDCPSTEDIIATEGDIEAVLTDGNSTIYTGYISTNFSWTIGQTGEQVLTITLESRGTRLLTQPYITTGKIFFDDNASSIIYNVCSKVGITIASGHDRVLLQPVSKVIEADTTCKQILDELFYECNACYYFDRYGQLCVYQINPDTSGAATFDSNDLYIVQGRAVSLTKKLRQYKGARVQYTVHGTASDYLVYRNTTDGDGDNPCNLTLNNGEYFDGTEIYTAQEWSDAQLDSFREPALIGAVNASSESAIVGSNKIVSISNLSPVVRSTGTITATFENVGGGYFKLTAHNAGITAKLTQLDLKASIVYEKSIGVIRTQMTGTSVNKSTLEEELTWIHDKDNATLHANMVSQYHQYSGASYSFHTKQNITLGSVIRLVDNLFTGLDVYVLVTNCTITDSDVIQYTGVGVSTFNLNENAFYRIIEAAKQSGAAGPQGLKGASTEVQYALGTSLTEPPTSEMMWGNADMLWDSDEMEWDSVIYTDTVPTLVDGYYIWMRQRVGDGDWQYSRLTGEEGEEAKIWDFTMDYETYKRNVRSSGFNPAITLTKKIQGYSTVGSWNCDHGVIVPSVGYAYLSIPYNNNYDTVTVTLSDGTNTISKTLSVIDVSNLDHDFGIWTSATLPVSYVDADGVTQPVYDGDFFVAGDVNGDGTDWTGDDGNTYKVGVPYIHSTHWNNPMSATQTNTSRMLQALGDVLNQTTIKPSIEALYGWFKNLVAQNAVIANLFTHNVTVGDGTGLAGTGFRFRAHAYDGNGNKLANPLFDIYFGDVMLFSVDSSGYIYFGSGFWYDPTDEAIHSSNDGVVIDNSGSITVNEGLYKSDLICPSFRSIPRETPTTTVTISNPASASALVSALANAGIQSLTTCTVDNQPSIAYINYSYSSYTARYSFYNSNMIKVGEAYINYKTSSSSWTINFSSSTLTIGTASTVSFKLLDSNGNLSVGTSTSGLESGELYYVVDSSGTTGTLHIKL